MIYLENDKASAGVNIKGAELSSFFDKECKVEHIWVADRKVWGRHAPILFPLVGKAEDDEFIVDGIPYKMGQHGFARDNDFCLVVEKEDTLIFELGSSAQTKQIYPFDFLLRVKYFLEQTALKVTYSVENTDSKEMFFNLGAHPGFNVPFRKDHVFSDYFLEFSTEETLDRYFLDEGGLMTGERKPDYLHNERTISLDDHLFENDALIFKGVKSEFISLKSKLTSRALKIGLGNFPFLGIWSKPKANAPFICLEPWYGHAAVRGSDKELSQRVDVSSLMPSEVLEDTFSIELTNGVDTAIS